MRRLPAAILVAVALVLPACRNTEEQVQPTSASPGVNPSLSPTVESVSPPSPTVTSGPTAGGNGNAAGCTRAESGEVEVVARNLAFDTGCISTRAGSRTSIELRNEDSANHTFAIYEDQDEVFKGGVTSGGEDRTYRLPALQPGTYRFQCDIHPSMNGTFRVS